MSPSWTTEKDGLLRSMAASGESSEAIGKLLNRTASAVRQRARTLQIKRARSRPGPKAKRRVLTKQAERAAQLWVAPNVWRSGNSPPWSKAAAAAEPHRVMTFFEGWQRRALPRSPSIRNESALMLLAASTIQDGANATSKMTDLPPSLQPKGQISPCAADRPKTPTPVRRSIP
jgi:hypothetical protein